MQIIKDNKILIIALVATTAIIIGAVMLLRPVSENPDIFAINPDPACTLEFEIFPVETPPTHLECVNYACAEVSGEGEDSCTNDSDCAYLTCQNESCVEQPCSTGNCENTCTTDNDCETPKHLECRDEACVYVDGEGTNECNSDNECKEETHLECVNEACKEVSGGGSNQCNTDNDCEEKKHLECRDEACVYVDGEGDNECNSDYDCKERTHTECRNESCVEVSGGGTNECNTDSDCRVSTSTPAPTSNPTYTQPTPTPQVPVTGITDYSLYIYAALVLLLSGVFFGMLRKY